jgi:hypothetical protein
VPARYSVGSAVNQTARQIGGALGVAILVVVLGTPKTAVAALNNFHHLWIYIASMTALAGVVSTALARPVKIPAPSSLDVEEARRIEEMLDGEIVPDGRARLIIESE